MHACNNIVKFFITFLLSSTLFSKSNDDVVLKSDLDSRIDEWSKPPFDKSTQLAILKLSITYQSTIKDF